MSSGAVVLSIPLFKAAPDGYFRKASNQEPVYMMRLGEIEVALPIDGIRKEFQVEANSEDGRMLALIIRALDFVSTLRPGDKLPSEVLSGEPSWEIMPSHRLRAYQRLSLQLATWITGEERVFTSAEELNQIAEDPNTKRKWNEAFDEAARRLGFEENGREQVMALVSALAEELAYIEALRDRFEEILPIAQRVQKLARLYARENSVREIADSVVRLLNTAKERLSERFTEIDGQTGEILPALQNPAQQVHCIRRIRDNLYCSLSVWRDLVARWGCAPMKRDESNVTLLRDSYRFLAPRYMPVKEWLRIQQQGYKKIRTDTLVVW